MNVEKLREGAYGLLAEFERAVVEEERRVLQAALQERLGYEVSLNAFLGDTRGRFPQCEPNPQRLGGGLVIADPVGKARRAAAGKIVALATPPPSNADTRLLTMTAAVLMRNVPGPDTPRKAVELAADILSAARANLAEPAATPKGEKP